MKKTGLTEWLKKIQDFSEFCTTSDLILLGFYHNEQAASYDRERGRGPAFFQTSGGRILYHRTDLMDYLKSIYHSGHKTQYKPLGERKRKLIGTYQPRIKQTQREAV